MTRLPWIPLAFAFASATLLFGQETVTAGAANGGFTASATFNPAFRMGLPALTGAPYCADEISEFQQTLNDGTHILQTNRDRRVCRDTAGRTRTERSLFNGARPGNVASANIMVVEILDPVSGVQYTLDTQHKIAHRVTIGTGNVNRPRLMRDTVTSTPATASILPAPAIRANVPAPNQPADSTPRPEMSNESLGTRMIEGIRAEGMMNKTVYPVNAEGNDRPITVTVETWMSPDLKISLLHKSSDPRHGDRINRVENLNRTEPDPSLFQPPPDYQVVDEAGTFKIDYTRQ